METYVKRNIKEIALYYLANLYYDREFLSWDKFEDMIVVFHQNSHLKSCWNKNTRKSFEIISLYLVKILEIIKRKKLYIDMDYQFMTLGRMDCIGHLSRYNEIAELSLKMRECMKDRTFVNDYILLLKEQMISQVMYLKCSYAIDESIKSEIFASFELLMQKSDNHPEDIFRIVKKLKRLLKKNQFLLKQKEIANVRLQEKIKAKNIQKVNQLNAFFYGEKDEKKVFMQKADAVLGRIYALQEIIQDESVRKKLSQEILKYNWSLCSENSDDIAEKMEQFEDIFETCTRKSKKL